MRGGISQNGGWKVKSRGDPRKENAEQIRNKRNHEIDFVVQGVSQESHVRGE